MYVQGGFAIHMQVGGKNPIYCYELLWNHNYQLSKLGKCACVCGGRVEMNPPPTNYATICGWWLCI